MKLEKGIITNNQLMMLIISFMEFSVLSINFAYSVTVTDTWIAVLAAYAIAIPVALGYSVLMSRNPGKTLVEINDIVLGPYIGKIFSALYIWYFFKYMIHFAYYFDNFWVTYITAETSRVALIIMLMAVCALAVRSGIEVIARCGAIFSVLVGIMILAVGLLLIKDMKMSNFLPILDLPPKAFVQSVHIILTIPFCDIVVFLMIMPFTKDNKKVIKPLLLAITISTAILLVMVLSSIAVAGARIATASSVTFGVTRGIDIANVLTRLDLLMAITLMLTIFIKICAFYYAATLGLAQLTKLRSYKILVAPVGALAAAIAANLYSSFMEQLYSAMYIWPFNALVFEIIMPALTLLVMAIRGKVRKRGAYE